MLFGEAREHLLTRQKLDLQGWTGRMIARAVADGTLIRLHHGVYVEGELWRTQFAEGRHLLRVAAVQGSRDRGDAVVSHVSAGVAWGLPLYRLDPDLVHLSGGMVDGHTLSGRPRIARHEILVADTDRTLVEGVMCTSLSRTVADVIRSLPIEAGISMADAAFRQVAWDETTHSYDDNAAAGFREAVRAHMERHRRARGVRLGRRVLALADGRAQLPGESVSRLRLIELGFAISGLQTPIPAPAGGTYYVDFDLAEVGAWGEFDGVGKYTELARAAGLTIDEVLLAEKRREDWIRGTTNRRMPRWGSNDIITAATLRARLASFHISPRT